MTFHITQRTFVITRETGKTHCPSKMHTKLKNFLHNEPMHSEVCCYGPINVPDVLKEGNCRYSVKREKQNAKAELESVSS